MKHKHNRLIAIAVSSILGTALSLAYADGQQPAVTPSSGNQQQTQQITPINPASQGPAQSQAPGPADENANRRDIGHDKADLRSDQQDIAKDRADIRSDKQDLRRDYAAQRNGANNQADISHDKADISHDLSLIHI